MRVFIFNNFINQRFGSGSLYGGQTESMMFNIIFGCGYGAGTIEDCVLLCVEDTGIPTTAEYLNENNLMTEDGNFKRIR